jgi:hypothetical protein
MRLSLNTLGRGTKSNIVGDDVAKALGLLEDREDAAGLAIEVVSQGTPIEEGLDAGIKRGVTDFLE